MRQGGPGLGSSLIGDPENIETYALRAAEFGLLIRGGFAPSAEDVVPPVREGKPSLSVLLFGNAGSSIWQAFSQSDEYQDGREDPLNRWSMRIGNALAKEWGGLALFPFEGPPYLPFIRWAKKSENLQSSQLGMLMHPVYGLWHAYRFAVALPFAIGIDRSRQAAAHACDSCTGKPCLQSCPVNAFDGERYDVKACYTYLANNPGSKCRQLGCRARVACPQGTEYIYYPDHATFHMEKFVVSQAK
jgi:hypothetical protein